MFSGQIGPRSSKPEPRPVEPVTDAENEPAAEPLTDPAKEEPGYPIDRYPIIPSSAPKLLAEIRKKFSLGHDVLRHVYISMHVAKFRSMGDTALQAGNSEAIIKKHYLNLMTPEEADAFWKIVPASRLADTSLRCCRDFRPLGAGRCSSLPVSQLSKKEV